LKRPDMTKSSHADTAPNPRPPQQSVDPGSTARSKRSLSSGEAPHVKRAKTGLTEERQLTPSLLSRITKPVVDDAEKTLRGRGAAVKKHIPEDSVELDRRHKGGYSIKGAAAQAVRDEELGDPVPRPSSLLDRLHRSQGADGGNPRKRRGKG